MLPEGITLLKDELVVETQGPSGELREVKSPWRHIILEVEPQVRTIRIYKKPGHYPTELLDKSYHLAFPKMRFGFWANVICVAFVGKRAFVGEDETLFIPLLPNMHSGGITCMGSGPFGRKIFACNDVDCAIRYLGDFWASEFDIHPRPIWQGIDHLEELFGCIFPTAFQKWQEKTQEDPNFINDIRFLGDYEIPQELDGAWNGH